MEKTLLQFNDGKYFTMILPWISLLQKCFQFYSMCCSGQSPFLLYTGKGVMVNKSLTAQTPPWEH